MSNFLDGQTFNRSFDSSYYFKQNSSDQIILSSKDRIQNVMYNVDSMNIGSGFKLVRIFKESSNNSVRY